MLGQLEFFKTSNRCHQTGGRYIYRPSYLTRKQTQEHLRLRKSEKKNLRKKTTYFSKSVFDVRVVPKTLRKPQCLQSFLKIDGGFKKLKGCIVAKKTPVLPNLDSMEKNDWMIIEKTQY